MRRSNRNFNIPHSPPWADLGNLTIFPARGVGNLTSTAFPGGGEFDPEVSGLRNVSSWGTEIANSYEYVFEQDERV